MTRDDATNSEYDAKLARLAKLAAAEKQQATTLRKTRREAKTVAVEALKAGIAEGRIGVRSEVQRNSPFSPPTIRALADEAGIPPDGRYVRAPKAAESAAASDPGDGQVNVEALSAPTLHRLARLAEEGAIADGASPGWAQRVTAGAPANRHPVLIVKAGIAEGYLTESQIPH